MATDPRKMRPSDLCRLLNSTPLGEVLTERQLRRHRTRAGLRVGNARYVDLFRYLAWLVELRHAPEPESVALASAAPDLAEAATGAAALGSRGKQIKGHGEKLTSKQEVLIAALLTEPTHVAAAAKAGVGETTVYRWMRLPRFRAAYRRARRELVEAAIVRIQAATGQAVEALLAVARQGRRDSDRVRAAIALLDHACRGLADADLMHEPEAREGAPMNAGNVVQTLSDRLRQLDAADLPTSVKSRLTATVSDALLRAISISALEERLQALEAMLGQRSDR